MLSLLSLLTLMLATVNLLGLLGSVTSAPTEDITAVAANEHDADDTSYLPTTFAWSLQCQTADTTELLYCGTLGGPQSNLLNQLTTSRCKQYCYCDQQEGNMICIAFVECNEITVTTRCQGTARCSCQYAEVMSGNTNLLGIWGGENGIANIGGGKGGPGTIWRSKRIESDATN
ncbi:hypothetical protein H2200_004646 [Cladophialophora chaetospira]|uniref:Uncharacterized protein n=1 Tax=Cladophialophora chaetospira TaxID=386627 RepID=A0AA39CJN6_9EURO|nr:hypothetical protein H2200_004646 [Cladophialophora chaetospira]